MNLIDHMLLETKHGPTTIVAGGVAMPAPTQAPGWVPELHIVMRRGQTFMVSSADGVRRTFGLFSMDENDGFTLSVYIDPATESEASVFTGGDCLDGASLQRRFMGMGVLLQSTDGTSTVTAFRLPTELDQQAWQPISRAKAWETVYLLDSAGRIGMGYDQAEAGWMILSAPIGFVPVFFQSAKPVVAAIGTTSTKEGQ